MPSPVYLLVGSLAIFLAGLVQGVSGFGFILVAVPVLLLLLDPPGAVVIAELLAAVVCVVMAIRMRGRVRRLETLIMVLAALPSIWFGVQALRYWPSFSVKVLTGLAVLAAVLPLLCGYRRHFRRERLAAIAAGAISGFFQGSTGMSGPPIVILIANQGWDREVFRASIATYLAVVTVLTLPLLALSGLLTPPLVGQAAWLGPALALGFAAGTWLAPRLNLRRFQLVAQLLVLTGGLVTLISGLAGLLA
jgi:uncharacterized membrane protein YfcA